MPILNYTTRIPAHKTVGEIQAILARAGASSVSVEYDRLAFPSAVTFLTRVGEIYVNFRLPSNWEGVKCRLQGDREVAKRFKTDEHARRVAWRIIKDWVEAQMAIIDANLATLPEVFLPYAVAPNGRTLFQEFESNRSLLLEGEHN